MPLPNIGTNIQPWNPAGLAAAPYNHPPVTGGNEVHQAKEGNLTWNGNTMQISAIAPTNYAFIPAFVNQASYAVVDCNGVGDFYVISDQYGGCEYHELYNAQFNRLAFVHVYRGDGITTAYTMAAGWQSRSVTRSAVIAERGGMTGTNLSVSLVDRTVNPPTVISKFVHVARQFNAAIPGGYAANGAATVTDEDDGTTTYAYQTASRFVRTLGGFWT